MTLRNTFGSCSAQFRHLLSHKGKFSLQQGMIKAVEDTMSQYDNSHYEKGLLIPGQGSVANDKNNTLDGKMPKYVDIQSKVHSF